MEESRGRQTPKERQPHRLQQLEEHHTSFCRCQSLLHRISSAPNWGSRQHPSRRASWIPTWTLMQRTNIHIVKHQPVMHRIPTTIIH